MKHSSTYTTLHSPNRSVRNAINRVYLVVGAKAPIIARNSAKLIAHRNVHKAVASVQTHAIVVIYSVPADAPDQQKRTA